MKIAITGASGLVGSALSHSFKKNGHTVIAFVRSGEELSDDDILWDTTNGVQNPEKLEGVDIVINLAGESIAGVRWTEEKKKKILNSRVQGTRRVIEALSGLENPPKLLLNASAMGYYGDRGDELVDEESPQGKGFLAMVCGEWEKEALQAEKLGLRVVLMRFGLVLSKKGGALDVMLTPFNLGVGGVVGSGEQWMSWIAIDDLVGVVHHVIEDDAIHGPVNVTTPKPVRNREFTKTLGSVLNRPTVVPFPAFAAKLLFGEMAEEMLLSSIRVNPKVLSMVRYPYLYPELEGALRHILD